MQITTSLGSFQYWRKIYHWKYFVKQADVLIVESAIEKFNSTNTTIVVGKDVNLLVILTAPTPTKKIIYFLKPGIAQQ